MSATSSSAITRTTHRSSPTTVWRAEVADLLPPPTYVRWKRLLDRVAAALLLVPAVPMIALLVVLVRLTSRGPGIYRQVRVGQRGRKFMMYKIRTMRRDAEAQVGPVWTHPSDARVTLPGRLLRKLHLDELPQLLNVLKGEMSLVGPRPERPEFVEVLAGQIPGYVKRLAVPPGVTGLAQLNLPPDTDLDSVRRKLVLDLEYIEHAGLFLDLRLFLCTLMRVFKLPEGPVLRLLGVQRAVTIPVIHAPSANGSNGNGRDPATPANIAGRVIEAAAEAIEEINSDGDGNGFKGAKPKPK
jgi:lipopolysaccharide/colanic/teichoic acid biosynthesis glycosyltransferase